MPMIMMECSTTTTSADAIIAGKGTYYGCSVLGAGSGVVRDSTVSSAGTIIHNVGLPGQMLGGNGIEFQNGLSVVTAVTVTIYYTRAS